MAKMRCSRWLISWGHWHVTVVRLVLDMVIQLSTVAPRSVWTYGARSKAYVAYGARSSTILGIGTESMRRITIRKSVN